MTTSKRYDSVWDAIEEHPVEAENLKVRAALMADPFRAPILFSDGTNLPGPSQTAPRWPRCIPRS